MTYGLGKYGRIDAKSYNIWWFTESRKLKAAMI
jgi:hypothetical protein